MNLANALISYLIKKLKNAVYKKNTRILKINLNE